MPVAGSSQDDARPDGDTAPPEQPRAADPIAGSGSGLSGEHLFLACAGCHGLNPEDTWLVGPHLAQIVGRQAGALADYPYSPALSEATFAWDRSVLFSWIVAAESLLPGTHMLYRNHLEPDEVFRLIDFLDDR